MAPTGKRQSLPAPGEPIHAAALALWKHRELSYPPHTRRDPDTMDVASGAWARCIREAEAAVNGYLSAMHKPS
jgi:hypothetical protein